MWVLIQVVRLLIEYFQNSEHNAVKEPFVSICCHYTILYHKLRPRIIEEFATLDDSKRWLETSLDNFAKDDGHGHYPEACIPAFVPQCCEIAVQNSTGKFFLSFIRSKSSYLEEIKLQAVLETMAKESISPSFDGCGHHIELAQFNDIKYYAQGREHLVVPGLMMILQKLDPGGNLEWNRVLVTSVSKKPSGHFERIYRRKRNGEDVPETKVCVHLADWGYEETVSVSDLRFMPKQFLGQPALAFRAYFGQEVPSRELQCDFNKCERYVETVRHFCKEDRSTVYFSIQADIAGKTCLDPIPVKIYKDMPSLAESKLHLEVWPEQYYNYRYQRNIRKKGPCTKY